MTYSWGSRSRLSPVRMVWLRNNYNEPKYEIIKYSRISLKRHTLVDNKPCEAKMESHKWKKKRFAGKLGHWPNWRPDKFKRKVSSQSKMR